MLRLMSIITICLVRVKSIEVCDDKYYLTTSGTAESVDGFEQAQRKCSNSRLLEIYDEKVVALLKNLKLDNQGILLGMTRNTNGWTWSGDTKESKVQILMQTDSSDEVACITNKDNHSEYISKKMSDFAGAICSKTVQVDNCTGWFHNGMCYFKPNSFYYTWFGAHNECIKNGAILAIFDDLETNFNKSVIDNQCYLVSLSRNTWRWMNSGVVTFNKWSIGNPYTNPNSYNPTCATTDNIGNDWKSVSCNGKFHIVCMREINQGNPGCTQQANNSTSTSVTSTRSSEPTNQPSFPKPGENSNFSEPTNEGSLSIGAKVGIGVGVSFLLIIIIIVVGVLVFKYFHHCKKTFEQKSSTKTLESENHYAEIVPGNKYTESTDNNHSAISYADLDLQSRNTLANYD